MPAAAVIPAPLAYINVVAVKKLVVGFVDVRGVPFWIQLPASSFWVESVALSCRAGDAHRLL